MFLFYVSLRIVLKLEGKSIDHETSADSVVNIVMNNAGRLNVTVAEVSAGEISMA